MKNAMFGAGCFWGVEKKFYEVEGVIETSVGYSGGHTKNPTYEEVCSDNTGHAEVVKLKYDENIVSYDELVNFFFDNHNPTTLNRQGVDIGSQYRSVIFFYDQDQKEIAEKILNNLDESNKFLNPIVTQIEPANTFYKAEEYHQKYLFKKK